MRKPKAELIVELDGDYNLQRAAMLWTTEKFISTQYGPRCEDYEPECCVCRMWATLDVLTKDTE